MNYQLPNDFDPRKGLTGTAFDARKDATAQLRLAYKGKQVSPPAGMDHFEIECEVYVAPDQSEIMVHSACPKCRHAIKITSDNKEISFDPKRGLFIEPFTCSWEMGDAMAAGDRRIDFGLGLCGMRVAYDGFVIKDA